MRKIFLCLFLTSSLFVNGQTSVISTVAGSGAIGYTGDGGLAIAAGLLTPECVYADKKGNIFISQADHHCVRKVDINGIITTVAGNGVSGTGGDGGPATAAQLNTPECVIGDTLGNLYIADCQNSRVRKIDTFGVITTIAGTGVQGFSGDGGPATAAKLSGPSGLAMDNAGNIYVSNLYTNRIRKITSAGIISTIAGNGTAGFSGDGGPAVSCMLNGPNSIALDNTGNLYLADLQNNRIRKINASGIITTVAGNGTSGYSGDGGLATIAKLNFPTGVAADASGNIYVADRNNCRVRKVSTDNHVISTIAGATTCSFSGDGFPPVSATLNYPNGVSLDQFGNLYIADFSNRRLRKVVTADYFADSFSVLINRLCGGPNFTIQLYHYTSGFNMVTYFGDGSTSSTNFVIGGINFSHAYSTPGTYSIKHILYNGGVRVDSIQYSYEYLLCNTYPVKFYYDNNSNCRKDSTEYYSLFPMTIEVDSNSVAIDTVSTTSGIYYDAYGNAGDVYTFKVIGAPGGLYVSCPSSGIISDTIQSSLLSKPTKYFGLFSSTGGYYDIAEFSSSRAGRHMSSGTILVNNSYSNAQSTTITMNISPDYVYESASPLPSSVAGNTITWNIGPIAANLPPPPVISYTLNTPTPLITSTWLTPGTPINSVIIANPTSGDADTLTNVIIRTDTVKSSYDPNEVQVMPGGYILSGTKLKYTVNFENTGNDTAHNIYVMDTLSPNVDPTSLRILAASAVMNITMINGGGYNVVKFDFPGINLLDSSHHNQCDGMVVYTVKARAGLADGVSILNHAGIYFDDNPVVMTNTAVDVISLIQGNSTICEGDADTLSIMAPGGTWTSSNGHATISPAGIVTAVSAGIDTIKYRTIVANDTVTTQKIIAINPLPHAGTITGIPTVCVLSMTTLTNAVAGGVWSSSAASATIIGGVVSGIAAGNAIISYSFTNSCGTAVDTMMVTINPLPNAGSITGSPIVCAAALTTLADLATGGIWSSSGSSALVAGGVVTGVSAGNAIISYSVTNGCGTAVDTMMVTINPLPIAGAITGPSMVCEGGSVTLMATAPSGVWNSSTSSASVTVGVVSGILAGTTIISYSLTNSCGTATDTLMMTVNPLPNAGSIIGMSPICIGTTMTVSTTATGGTWTASNSYATVVAGVVTGVSAGNVTISYTVGNSCGNAYATLPIIIESVEDAGTILGLATVCEGGTITLTTTSPTPGTWNEITGNTSVTGGIVTGINPGFDTVSYIVSNSCGSDIAEMVVFVSQCNTGVVPIAEGMPNLVAYPNPNSGSFIVVLSQPENNIIVSVMDVAGRVLQVERPSGSATRIPVSLNNVASGSYIIKVETDSNIYREKVTIW